MYRFWFSLRDIFDSFPPEVNVVKEINFITKFVRLVGPHSKKKSTFEVCESSSD